MKITEEKLIYNTVIDGVEVIIHTRDGYIEQIGTTGVKKNVLGCNVMWYNIELLRCLPYVNKAIKEYQEWLMENNT